MELRRRDRGARLRALTSAAYTAAAGHLEVTPEDDVVPARRRWAPSLRSAVVAGVVVLLCALAVTAASWLGRPADPVPLPAPSRAGASPGAAVAREGPGNVEDQGGADGATADLATEAAGGTGSPDRGPGGQGPSAGAGPAVVVVHVAGAVAVPGVVELPTGARVADALEAAGGAGSTADLGAVNLARLLVDGEQVYVPEVGERPVGAGPAGGAGGGAGAGPGGASGTDPGAEGAPSAPVNLNTASAAELDSLPGVGPAIAERILQWRELNGWFTSVDDLDEVSGIGPATLERLRPLVTV